MFDAIRRLLTGRTTAPQASPASRAATCPDCGVRAGELHQLFCTRERCPFCRGQLCACDCAGTILQLTAAEQRVLDDYVDDTVPPLSQIRQRWRETLEKTGRIPFEPTPDDPWHAAYRGDLAALQHCVATGFHPQTANEIGYTVLMAAARGEQLEILRFLLSQGAAAPAADQTGSTALHCVVSQAPVDPQRQVACLRLLMDAGAELNAQNKSGISPLMHAAWFGCHECVRELLTRGADPHLRDHQGRTARDLAQTRGHTALLKLLP
ncbi:MAG: ankyrin repeat domain-containing protein [Planctomycetes bacterium]|nr:ankyrin repeat domain-containing protein [Planctomycetota bacterium]